MTNDELAELERLYGQHPAVATLISEVKRLRGIIKSMDHFDNVCEECLGPVNTMGECLNPKCKMGPGWPKLWVCPTCHQDVTEYHDRETGHAAGCKEQR